ncbi:MAG: hypothetical protein RL685_3653 [Pseudomonadota bacterium]|jgi:hypothetical protein
MHLLDELTSLDDAALHGALKHTAGKGNALTAQLLAQLAELEARGLYRERACSSLYMYCVYELRMSEDEAQRRCRAARLTRQFPVLIAMLAEAAIHLTGILLLGPHLTVENHVELLARARHRTKREIERLVATIAPGADVPAMVKPLCRAGAEGVAQWEDLGPYTGHGGRVRNTWAAFVQALAGPVRRLQSGIGAGQAPPAPIDVGDERSEPVGGGTCPIARSDALERAQGASEPEPPNTPAGMRYHVQFSADQGYVDLLEEADRNLVEVQRRALQLLVDQLRRRKHAATERPRAAAPAQPPTSTPAPARGRHLPAALRRAVWQRDDGCCAYVDERGVRCRETAGLEFHHVQAYARGGPNTEENVALRCRAHNALAAEGDFGAEWMRACRRTEGERRAGAGSEGSGADGRERPSIVFDGIGTSNRCDS